MSPEIIQIVLPLTFLGISGLVAKFSSNAVATRWPRTACSCRFRERGPALRPKSPQEHGRHAVVGWCQRAPVQHGRRRPTIFWRSWWVFAPLDATLLITTNPAVGVRCPKSTTPSAIEPKAAVRRAWRCPAHHGYADSPRGDRPSHRFQGAVEHLRRQHAGNAQQQDGPLPGVHPQHSGRRQHRRRNGEMHDEAAFRADPFAEAAERNGEFLFPRTGHGWGLGAGGWGAIIMHHFLPIPNPQSLIPSCKSQRLVEPPVRKTLDHQVRGAEILAATVLAGHGDGEGPGGGRRAAAVLAVFQHEHFPGRHAETPRGQQVDLRVGLSPRDVFRRENETEPRGQLEGGQAGLGQPAARCWWRSPWGCPPFPVRPATPAGPAWSPTAGQQAKEDLVAFRGEHFPRFVQRAPVDHDLERRPRRQAHHGVFEFRREQASPPRQQFGPRQGVHVLAC